MRRDVRGPWAAFAAALCAACSTTPAPVDAPREHARVVTQAPHARTEAPRDELPELRPAPSPSAASVRFKRHSRLNADFAAALALPPDVLCRELGLYSCAEDAHVSALGGTDAFHHGLFEPRPHTDGTAPLIVERIALSGCGQRVTLDLARASEAVLYRDLTLDPAGRLDPGAPAVTESIDRLYRRALLRRPSAREVAHLLRFYREVEAAGTPEPGRAWMTLACLAVLTSVESLFY